MPPSFGNLRTLFAFPLRSLLFALFSRQSLQQHAPHCKVAHACFALQRLLCSVLILVITAGFARASALICSTLSMVRLFRKPSPALLSDPISQLSLLLQSLICTAEVMLAAAPDLTLFSALSFSPCLAADISTHFCATDDDDTGERRLYQKLYRFFQRLLPCFSFPSASTPYTISTQVRNNLPRSHFKILLTDIEPGHTSLPAELLSANATSALSHYHHHQQCHCCSTSRSGPTPVCLFLINSLLSVTRALLHLRATLHAASPTPESHLHHSRMALLRHILHPGAKIPSHSPSCTTSSCVAHKLSPPA